MWSTVGHDASSALGQIFSPSGITQLLPRAHRTDKSDRTRQRADASCRRSGSRQLAVARRRRRAGSQVAFLLLVINVFLGLVNLVPLLPFDGGHIAIATYEKIASTVTRRQVTGRRRQAAADRRRGAGRAAVHRGLCRPVPRHHAPGRATLLTAATAASVVTRRRRRTRASCMRAAARSPGHGRTVRSAATGLGAVDDDHQDRRRRRHARADLRARGRRLPTSCAARATKRKPRIGLAQIVPRSPVPIVADIHFQYKLALARDGSRRAGAAAQPGQHPQTRAHQARRARGQGPRAADPHRRERGFARPRDGRAARRHHARGARRVGDARARPVPRGRLRRREDLGEGIERPVDDRRVPAARRDHRPPAAPRRHRSRPAAAGLDQVGRRHRHAARRRHRRHDPLLADRRPGRGSQGGPGAARGARACGSARASTSSRARRAVGPRST